MLKDLDSVGPVAVLGIGRDWESGEPKRPDAKRLVKIAEQWRPWRSAAALLLWHYRRNMPDWSAKAPKVETKPK